MSKKILSILLSVLIIFSSSSLFGEIPEIPAQPGESNTISLDFKGMDIVDVLKLLAQRGDMNISVSKTVRGRVTIFLKEVDVQDAFEIILASNGLAYDVKGGIINVMTEKDYQRLYGTEFDDKRKVKIFQLKHANVTAVSKAINQVKSKIGKVVTDEASNTIVVIDSSRVIIMAQQMIRKMDLPTETRIFALDYAKVEDVKSKIEERLTKDVGSIQVDERTNKAVVTDLSEKLPEIERLISELDEKTQQVLIEAKIIQVTLNDEYKMGVNWDYIFHEGYNVATGFNFRNLSTIAGGVVNDILPAATGAITGSAFRVGSLDEHDYQYIVEILQTMGKTEILSAPRIVVINNEEASILVGSSRPYATTGTTIGETLSETTQQVTYVDLGVKLHVTPTINRDGFVTMKIKPEISARTGDVETTSTTSQAGGQTVTDTTSIPIIQTSTAETTVMVKNGNTIVIGGLIEDRNEEKEDKVPILGDIPLIGEMFKRTTRGNTEEAEKTELVIFLTPYIITGEAAAPEIKDYLTTTKVGKSEIKQPEDKRVPTHFAGSSATAKPKGPSSKRKKRKLTAPPKPSTSKGYYNTVRSMVYEKARQNYPRSEVRGNVYVVFDLFANGQLKTSPRILGYADKALRMLAIKSVYDAAPFPPFPANLRKSEETFKIVISYD